jgi:FAD synthase
MEVVHGYRDLPRPLVRAAIAIGNFDGVHVGHAALIAAARAATDGDVGVLTFEPHPAQVLAPHAAPARLTTPARKLELLAAAGVDVVVVAPFTPRAGGAHRDRVRRRDPRRCARCAPRRGRRRLLLWPRPRRHHRDA